MIPDVVDSFLLISSFVFGSVVALGIPGCPVPGLISSPEQG
jgi:hypothetical protein